MVFERDYALDIMLIERQSQRPMGRGFHTDIISSTTQQMLRPCETFEGHLYLKVRNGST